MMLSLSLFHTHLLTHIHIYAHANVRARAHTHTHKRARARAPPLTPRPHLVSLAGSPFLHLFIFQIHSRCLLTIFEILHSSTN